MLPYMQAEEEKARKQQERDQLKAEKAANSDWERARPTATALIENFSSG